MEATIQRDANRVPIQGLFSLLEKKLITFNGGTVNGVGDFDGTQNPYTLFTVTGDVVVEIFGVVKTSLEGATAKLEVGVTGGVTELIAQTTATDLDANEEWTDATPANTKKLPSEPSVIGNGQDIILTVETANITAGVIQMYCFWYPLSDDGNVVAA